jgi:hypothetical protein
MNSIAALPSVRTTDKRDINSDSLLEECENLQNIHQWIFGQKLLMSTQSLQE